MVSFFYLVYVHHVNMSCMPHILFVVPSPTNVIFVEQLGVHINEKNINNCMMNKNVILIEESYHYTVCISPQNTIVMLAEVHHIWENTAPKIHVGRGGSIKKTYGKVNH